MLLAVVGGLAATFAAGAFATRADTEPAKDGPTRCDGPRGDSESWEPFCRFGKGPEAPEPRTDGPGGTFPPGVRPMLCEDGPGSGGAGFDDCRPVSDEEAAEAMEPACKPSRDSWARGLFYCDDGREVIGVDTPRPPDENGPRGPAPAGSPPPEAAPSYPHPGDNERPRGAPVGL